MTRTHAVVVGFDGSTGSQSALNVAVWEASRRRLPLRIVHGYLPPVLYSPIGLTPYSAAVDAPLHTARHLVHDAARTIRSRYPDLDVATAVIAGSPAGVLVEESRQATLVVVGCRGLGGFSGLLLGSVSSQVATHAVSPVIVVRPEAGDVERSGPVVVGVDGSAPSMAAIEFAFDEAAARHVPVVAQYIWVTPPTGNLGPITEWHYDPREAADEAERVLAELVAGWSEKYPDVAVHRQPIHAASPAELLLESADEAGLIVVGNRGRGGFAELLLGSVSRALIHHANCPVAVVHRRST
ncbi:MAG TPA: universal stress protein [Micromonosporaceae bacterium]